MRLGRWPCRLLFTCKSVHTSRLNFPSVSRLLCFASSSRLYGHGEETDGALPTPQWSIGHTWLSLCPRLLCPVRYHADTRTIVLSCPGGRKKQKLCLFGSFRWSKLGRYQPRGDLEPEEIQQYPVSSIIHLVRKGPR